MGQEIGVFGGSYKFKAALLADFRSTRVMDTPICEERHEGGGSDGEQLAEIGGASIPNLGTDLTLIGYSRAAVIAVDVVRQLEQGAPRHVPGP
jgi:pyruvate/2-oxoglutarate/acetoin dehydrogenase E1 component